MKKVHVKSKVIFITAIFLIAVMPAIADRTCATPLSADGLGPSDLIKFLNKNVDKKLSIITEKERREEKTKEINLQKEVEKIKMFSKSIRECPRLYAEYRGEGKEFNKIFLLTLFGSLEDRLIKISKAKVGETETKAAAVDAEWMVEKLVKYLKGEEDVSS